MGWKLVTLRRHRLPGASAVIHTPASVLYVFQAFAGSCMHEGLGGSMDLSGNWALEEGGWLSHTGDHHFPNTRAGMATFPIADSHDLCSDPECTHHYLSYFKKTNCPGRLGLRLLLCRVLLGTSSAVGCHFLSSSPQQMGYKLTSLSSRSMSLGSSFPIRTEADRAASVV